MKIINVVQGHHAWHDLHCNRLTSSRFKTVLHGGPRAWKTLMRNMRPTNNQGNHKAKTAAALDWGLEHEPLARMEYELSTGRRVKQVGFILADDDRFGVSPDGLVKPDGMIEVKCPYSAKVHEATWRRRQMPAEHQPQVQGIMWVGQLDWCDFVSFDPRRLGDGRLVVIRVPRDDAYIRRLSDRCDQFFELYHSMRDPTKSRPIPKLF